MSRASKPLVGVALLLVLALLVLFRRPPAISTGAIGPRETPRTNGGTVSMTVPNGPDGSATLRTSVEPPPREAHARLRIRVVASETGEPLPGIAVTLAPVEHWNELGGVSLELVAHEEVGGLHETDIRGETEFELPLDRRYRVRVFTWNGSAVERHVDVAELEAGPNELEIALKTVRDLTFFGRVLERPGGAPVAGALVRHAPCFRMRDGRVMEEECGPVLSRTDAGGIFELALFAPGGYVSIAADGRSPSFVTIEPGHVTRQTALEASILHSATLCLRVVDGEGLGIAGSTVRVDAYAALLLATLPDPFLPPDDATWEATTDAEGRVAFTDLPVEAELGVEVLQGRQTLRHMLIVLAAGEERELEWSIGGGARIGGRALETGGAAFTERDVVLVPAEKEGLRQLTSLDAVFAVARTDASGRFRFENVPASAWWIASKPEIPRRDGAGPVPFVPFPLRVDVLEGVDAVEVVLTVAPGSALRGRVLDDEDRPLEGCRVGAFATETRDFLSAYTRSNGDFVIGPLPAGEYEVFAGGFGQERYAAGEPRVVRTGEEGIVLRARRAGSVRGKVVDALTLETCEAKLRLPEASSSGRRRTPVDTHTMSGAFHATGLEPGPCVIVATTADGRIGYRSGIEIASGVETGGVDVPVSAGARLRVFCAGKDGTGSCEILAGDAKLDSITLTAGTSRLVAVPAERLVVRETSSKGSFRDRTITLRPGETHEIVIGAAR